MKKKFFIETFGCQMNKCDSELMAGSMVMSGFIEAETAEETDIFIVNTCSVRAHAENRALSRIRASRKKSKGMIIIITGCMAQRIGRELIDKKIADLVIGPFQSPDIGNIIKIYLTNKTEKLFLSLEKDDLQTRIRPDLHFQRAGNAWHEWITITHGCENFCSYCIVPHVRGPLISFPSRTIIEYIRMLTDRGIREITLLGQNVNQYGTDSSDIPFHKLLEQAAAIKGIIRINFITSHPKDFNEDIIRVIRDNDVISRSIHLPLQSGSDRVLRLMNRKYTMNHYFAIVEKINMMIDSYSISTDLIVGFPGETEDDFYTTLDAVEKIRFDEAFTYAYSPREGTSAFGLKEELTKEEKIGRLNRLIYVQRRISRERMEERINQTEEMIIERISKKSTSEVMGKTFLNHPVITRGTPEEIGKKIEITITGIKGSTLYGERTA
jgi:tRNA-2-methylthio-N6-dimethylallyladenosine synthase